MIIAGTGHRPPKLLGFSLESHNDLTQFAISILESTPEVITRVISGGALGWDQALASAAHHLKLHSVIAVPCDGQDAFWHADSRKLYKEILDAADEVVIVCNGGYASWKMQVRNEWMVDNCARVLALWDGHSGGTANCVNYADKIGKPVVNVWDHFVEAFPDRKRQRG
jgi:uncharacterized phage-like protein YoqJ